MNEATEETWRIFGDDEHVGDIPFIDVCKDIDGGTEQVCAVESVLVDVTGHLHEEEFQITDLVRQRAALIAAAPTLYRALDHLCDVVGDDLLSEVVEIALAKAREALEAATAIVEGEEV